MNKLKIIKFANKCYELFKKSNKEKRKLKNELTLKFETYFNTYQKMIEYKNIILKLREELGFWQQVAKLNRITASLSNESIYCPACDYVIDIKECEDCEDKCDNINLIKERINEKEKLV